MKNLNDTLPELMRRATENLEPESTDLVERGMARGLTLRRRRTTLFTVAGATAVLATAGVIVGGSQLFANDAQAPSAGTTTKQPATNANGVKGTAPKPVTKKETLDTLVKLLPARLKVIKTDTWGDSWGNGAFALVDDGQGLSKVEVAVSAPGTNANCSRPPAGTCSPRPDGSRLSVYKEEAGYQKDNNPGGVLINRVDVQRRDSEAISLMSINAVEEKGVKHTRAKPALTTAELTAIADSKLWRFPPKPPLQPTGQVKPELKNPGAGKPAVPVQDTLQTLKKVLPKNLQTSKPTTRGGTPEDFNAASYLVNDGKGLSWVEAFVTYQVPVTKCEPERATTYCQVRADGSVVGWNKNSPEYSDARQAKDGVLSNTATIQYRDGRYISITSYNAVEEKGSKHTRAKPALTVEQLLAMAGNKDWKFPGTKK